MGELVASTTEVETDHKHDGHSRRKPEPKDIDPSKPMAHGTGERSKATSVPVQDNVSVGSTDQATFLSDGAGDTIANGEAGFSRRMLLETNAAANSLEGWDEMQLRNVVPNVVIADRQTAQRAKEAEHQKEKAAEFGNPPSVTATYEIAEAWCMEHAREIQTDVGDEQAKFTSFNAWVPRANGFYSSLMRLHAQQKMLGATDADAMVKQLVAGLGDVSQVAARMQLAHDQGHAEPLQVPAVDGTLDQLAQETTLAASEMNTAYRDFQKNLLEEKEDAVHHTGDKSAAELAQINQNKAFVRNAGKTIDLAMAVVDGAPAGIATATNAMHRAEATFGAMANKRQAMNGARQTHNPTYVTTDTHGNMVVRNVQTGQDRGMAPKPGEASAHTPSPEEEVHLPSGVSDVLGQLVDFAYSSEVAKINAQLEQIKNQCAAIHAVFDMNTTIVRAAAFQDKLNAFALKCNQLQARMASRRQHYLEFGVQLDNFARTDHSSQKAGLGPSKGHERYATIMTVASTVREVLSIGKGALNGFDSSDKLKAWIRGIYERRERVDSGRKDIQYLKMPGGELMQMVEMYQQVDQFESNVVKQLVHLGPVEEAAAQVLGQLSQGGGGSTSGGQY